jgi:hypothetical protein
VIAYFDTSAVIPLELVLVTGDNELATAATAIHLAITNPNR